MEHHPSILLSKLMLWRSNGSKRQCHQRYYCHTMHLTTVVPSIDNTMAYSHQKRRELYSLQGDNTTRNTIDRQYTLPWQ